MLLVESSSTLSQGVVKTKAIQSDKCKCIMLKVKLKKKLTVEKKKRVLIQSMPNAVNLMATPKCLH